MVLSGKPSVVPNLLNPPVKPPPPPVPKPSFNSAFASFLQNQSRTADMFPDPMNNRIKPVKLEVPSNSPPKVIAQPIRQQHSPIKMTSAIAVSAQVNKSPAAIMPQKQVNIVQQKQEAWTSKVLKQSQQAMPLPQQRVTTEKIYPYVAGQSQLYANQVRNENGQQRYYTISTSSSPNTSPQPRLNTQQQSY